MPSFVSWIIIGYLNVCTGLEILIYRWWLKCSRKLIYFLKISGWKGPPSREGTFCFLTTKKLYHLMFFLSLLLLYILKLKFPETKSISVSISVTDLQDFIAGVNVKVYNWILIYKHLQFTISKNQERMQLQRHKLPFREVQIWFDRKYTTFFMLNQGC